MINLTQGFQKKSNKRYRKIGEDPDDMVPKNIFLSYLVQVLEYSLMCLFYVIHCHLIYQSVTKNQ